MNGIESMQNNKKILNLSKTLEYVIDFIHKNGPFDGIFAFSQGIIVGSVLLKLDKLQGSEYPKIPFEKPKFAIFFGSCMARVYLKNGKNPLPQSWREDFDVPILYWIGEKEREKFSIE